MFHDHVVQVTPGTKWAIGILALLSSVSLCVTAWILADFNRELEIVQQITRHLPDSDLPEVTELGSELRLQSRLSILLIVNIIASGVALLILVRAYVSSESSLRNVRVLAADILASLDQGIITTDRDATILSINKRGRELLSSTKTDIGRALKDLPEEHQPLDEICQYVLDLQKCIRDRDYIVKDNGHTRTLRAGCSLLRDHDEKLLGTVIHLRDVTEKTFMEQRLRRMERYMGLGTMAAGLQHEIKNPLSALSLHVQLLKEGLEEHTLSKSVQENLEVLNLEVRRITSVLEGFRDFASGAELNIMEFDISELIDKFVRLIQPQAQENYVRIETQLPHTASTRFMGDRIRIEQVLLNLAINAIAAMPQGGVMSIRVLNKDTGVSISVSDTGSGIPQDLQDKIFDPYFTTRSTGTGMGLALSEKIVRQHGGTIDFETRPGETIFTVNLPRNNENL